MAPEVDLLRAGPIVMRLRRDAAAVASWSPRVRRIVYHHIWSEAAERLGADLEPLGPDFVVLRRGSARTVALYHEVMLDTAVSLLLALDKGIVNQLLVGAGLPVSTHAIVNADDPRAGVAFMARNRGPYVVKPLNASGGRGVICGVDDVESFHRAVVWAGRWGPQLVVEEQAAGEELRFLFLDGHLLGILRRRPTRLEADGRASVLELVEAENRRRSEAEGRLGMSELSIGLDSLLTLQRAGLTLRSVAPAGTRVPLASTANQSGAADSETVAAGEVAPELLEEARGAVAAVGLRLGSVEVITPDPTRSLREAGGVVLEVNGTPGLHYHYLVADPTRADRVAIPILAALLGDDPAEYAQS